MTLRNALASLVCAGALIAVAAPVTAKEPVCADGTWSMDGGPLAVGPIVVETIRLREGAPWIASDCAAVRWHLRPSERGGSELRALFVCSADPRPRRLGMRLRARIAPACGPMAGIFGARRFDAVLRFTATPTDASCTSHVECPPNEFCRSPEGACGAPGSCAVIGQVCPENYDPVCGCDGITYDNRCFASAAAVSVAKVGPCECVPKTAPCVTTCDCYAALGTAFCNDCPLLCPSCGDYWQCKDGACVEQCGVFPPEIRECLEQRCVSNVDCADDRYCAKPVTGCDQGGICEGRPGACPDVYLPVCGCDGRTYSNACDAAAAGVSVASEGECRTTCGGIAGLPCPVGQVCDLGFVGCDTADAAGTCVPHGFCTQEFVTVCGCDGKTYPNDCERRGAGVALAHPGVCNAAATR